MTSSKIILVLLGMILFTACFDGCAEANRKIASRRGFNREQNMQDFFTVETLEVGETFSGEASFYGAGFHGHKAADGSVYDQNALTCASKTLPFHTHLKVTLESTGKSVLVRVTDRGPYMDGRVLDLSVAAAKVIGLDRVGVGTILVEVVE